MIIVPPHSQIGVDVPDEWWEFCGMSDWRPQSLLYPYKPSNDQQVDVVNISDIEPPQRDPGVAPFKKYKLVPVLLAFQSPECALPPVCIADSTNGAGRHLLLNGFHRYYASVAVGYTQIPVVVLPSPHDA